MAEPVNLNKFRKAKARADKEQSAVENRIKHGRTKAEKARDRAASTKQGKALDEKRRDPD